MGSFPRLVVLGAAADPVVGRWASALGGRVVARGRSLLLARPELVIARVPVADLGRVALAATIAGAAAVIAAPIGAPTALPRWERRFHRFFVEDPDTARAWVGAGIALGRVVLVSAGPDEGSAIRAAIEEVRAMALRPDIRPRAR